MFGKKTPPRLLLCTYVLVCELYYYKSSFSEGGINSGWSKSPILECTWDDCLLNWPDAWYCYSIVLCWMNKETRCARFIRYWHSLWLVSYNNWQIWNLPRSPQSKNRSQLASLGLLKSTYYTRNKACAVVACCLHHSGVQQCQPCTPFNY